MTKSLRLSLRLELTSVTLLKEYNGSTLGNSYGRMGGSLGGTWGKVAVGFVQTFLTDATMDKIIIALNIADSGDRKCSR